MNKDIKMLNVNSKGRGEVGIPVKEIQENKGPEVIKMCMGMTQRDVMGREVGGGFMFGNAYKN